MSDQGPHRLAIGFDLECRGHPDRFETSRPKGISNLLSGQPVVVIVCALPVPLDEQPARSQQSDELRSCSGIVIEERADRRAHDEIIVAGYVVEVGCGRYLGPVVLLDLGLEYPQHRLRSVDAHNSGPTVNQVFNEKTCSAPEIDYSCAVQLDAGRLCHRRKRSEGGQSV